MSEPFVELLRQVPLFDVFTEEECRLLAEHLQLETYPMGRTVYEAGGETEAFYIVVTGQARKISLSEGGKESNLGLISPGGHFGEHALVESQVSSPFVVRASTELTVLRIDREQFRQLVGQHPALEKYFTDYLSSEVMQTFLKQNTVLTHVDHAALRSLLDRLELRSYGPGDYLVREGEDGDAFYILKSGTALVEKGLNAAVVNRLYPGDFFGELALLTGEPRKASVRAASEQVTAFRLAKSDFDELIRRYPVILESMRRISAHYGTVSVDTVKAAAEAAEKSDRPKAPESDAAAAHRRRRPARSWGLLPWFRWRRYPALLQQNEMDCGSTCLTMIARYYGLKASVNRMRERCNVGTEGASMLALTETAESLGFKAKGLKTTYPLLKELQAPFIAHWNGNHYIIVYELRDDGAVIADPAVGAVESISTETFAKHWSGFAIELIPTEELALIDDRETLWSRYAAHFRPYLRLAASALVVSVLIELVYLIFPVMTQQIFDRVLDSRDMSLLYVLLLTMLGLSVFTTAGIAVRQSVISRLAFHIDRSMLERFYEQLFRLPYSYFTKRTSGDILTRIYENEKIRRLMTDQGVHLLLDVLTLLVYGGLMLYYHVGLALISLAVVPFYVALYAVLLPKIRLNYRKQQQAEGESQTQAVEAIGAIATVKGMAIEGAVRVKLLDKLQQQLWLRLEGSRLERMMQAGSAGLRSLSGIVLLFFGSRYVMNGELSVGGLVAFTVLFTSFMLALEAIAGMAGELAEFRIAMERLNDVYESTVEQPEPERLRLLPALRGHIRFENVSFRYYAGGRMILQQLNVDIEPGQTVALVGRSGSGKSTIASLLQKLLEPVSGTIYVDGYPLHGVDADSMRRQVGIVPQETVIFRGTVRDNIAMNGAVSFEELERAARLAGADSFIEVLPLGYDTMIGEGGIRLSGGQRQRIAIARALMHDPRILIFDEATSALDTESERIIQQNMDAMLQNRTTLIIAHRLSTIRHADLILVLDQGVIVESGSHEQLLQQRGLYHYLVNQQTV